MEATQESHSARSIRRPIGVGSAEWTQCQLDAISAGPFSEGSCADDGGSEMHRRRGTKTTMSMRHGALCSVEAHEWDHALVLGARFQLARLFSWALGVKRL